MDNVTGEREPEVSSLMTSLDHFDVPGSSLIVGVADVPGSILMLSLDHERPEGCSRGRTRPVEDGMTKAEGIAAADVIVEGFLSSLVPRVRAS